MPVFEPLLLCRKERGRRISVLIEVLGKAALGAGESNEIDGLARLRVSVPVLFDVGIADQAQSLLEALALARIVDENGEAAGIGGELRLVLGHVVADAVFRLAG